MLMSFLKKYSENERHYRNSSIDYKLQGTGADSIKIINSQNFFVVTYRDICNKLVKFIRKYRFKYNLTPTIVSS